MGLEDSDRAEGRWRAKRAATGLAGGLGGELSGYPGSHSGVDGVRGWWQWVLGGAKRRGW